MSDSLRTSFLGALQASLSVLLTIGVGVLASQFNIVQQSSTKELSTLCVRIFLPCLLISNLGANLHADTGIRYAPILVWALCYTLLSMLFGSVITRIFQLPSWVTPALSFNNTTSLPLLLIQSISSTGILSTLLMSDSDSMSDAINRAQSYFLVCAIVSNSLTFSIGPRLLDHEEAPEETEGKSLPDNADQRCNQSQYPIDDDTETANQGDQEAHNQNGNSWPTENTSLLPHSIVRQGAKVGRYGYAKGKGVWEKLSPKTRNILDLLYAFLNAPLIGAVIGALIGLAPPLHRAFFAPSENGGIFKAWLTSCIQSVGKVFAALQVVVVGVKLSSSLRKMKRGEESGNVPWLPSLLVLAMRFIVWPSISIAIVYALAVRAHVLPRDPVLWFCMMLMPTGPPAMAVSSLADCNDSSSSEKMSISKFLIIAYIVSPILCFTVVGALKATEAAITNS